MLTMNKKQKILQSFRNRFDIKENKIEILDIKEITKEEIKTYLIDSCGYSDDELEGMTKKELIDYVDDIESLLEFNN